MITKSYLSFIAILVFLFSCKERIPRNNDTGIEEFKTLNAAIPMAGNWLCEDYFKNIKTLKSPRRAQNESQFIIVPDSTLKETMMIYNFHEGGPILTVLKHGDKFEIWEVQNDSLIQLRNEIIPETSDKIKIGDKEFIKINPLNTGENPLILEDLLFKGNYMTADGKPVAFMNDGKVVGLADFLVYLPIIDYMDEGLQVDQVGLGKNEVDLNYYGFQFKHDTLDLFNLKCVTYDSIEDRCVEVDFGKLAYQLLKKD